MTGCAAALGFEKGLLSGTTGKGEGKGKMRKERTRYAFYATEIIDSKKGRVETLVRFNTHKKAIILGTPPPLSVTLAPATCFLMRIWPQPLWRWRSLIRH